MEVDEDITVVAFVLFMFMDWSNALFRNCGGGGCPKPPPSVPGMLKDMLYYWYPAWKYKTGGEMMINELF